ncbi:NRDE family protein [Flavobacterium sp. K5-23]|uniref:NRDE family protein n=1 Tax=Flavobacterium sp. K5-23 TaxID=2746225 RepID=UPI00200EF2B8|nr:NRDE family protein [Flavobacterium sp. K5-23]UQD56022.1 NRDE family protein [Flavobacterium sp. K5-23]
MCTVSFVKVNGKVVITSNRDEKVIRLAIPPRNYLINGKNVIFPKDPKAGGTWYAIDENGNVLVLLNGASEKHIIQESYRKSRGLIVLDIISSKSPKDFWQELNLENIEPFTLVLFQDEELFQLRWNGDDKETLLLDTNKNHIWASSTLYPKEIRAKRADLFDSFLESNQEVSAQEIHHFHRYAENENQENGLVINRNDVLKTLSITQTVIESNKVSITHYDLIENKEFSNTFITI